MAKSTLKSKSRARATKVKKMTQEEELSKYMPKAGEAPKGIVPKPSDLYKFFAGEYGTERSFREVPADLTIGLEILPEDARDIPEATAELIMKRLVAQKEKLDKALEWDAKEKELLEMTTRDSQTMKPLDPVDKKLNIKSWSIIMNMDMLRFQVEETSATTVTNMIAAHANGDDICAPIKISGNPRQLLEGACFYRNVKAIAYLGLVGDCDLDMKFKTPKGESQNCLGLMQADRKAKKKNDQESAWKAHKYLDELRLMKMAFTDILSIGQDSKCC